MSPTYVCGDAHPLLLRTSCSTRSNRENLFRSVLLSPAMDVMPPMILSSLRKWNFDAKLSGYWTPPTPNIILTTYQ